MPDFMINTDIGGIHPKERRRRLALAYRFLLSLDPPTKEADRLREAIPIKNENAKSAGGTASLAVEKNPHAKGDLSNG